jgi:hypothetical protein
MYVCQDGFSVLLIAWPLVAGTGEGPTREPFWRENPGTGDVGFTGPIVSQSSWMT